MQLWTKSRREQVRNDDSSGPLVDLMAILTILAAMTSHQQLVAALLATATVVRWIRA